MPSDEARAGLDRLLDYLKTHRPDELARVLDAHFSLERRMLNDLRDPREPNAAR